jgi:hypothetical protein
MMLRLDFQERDGGVGDAGIRAIENAGNHLRAEPAAGPA